MRGLCCCAAPSSIGHDVLGGASMAAERKRTCPNLGSLVGMSRSLLEPGEAPPVAAEGKVKGCTAVHCSRCSQPVRHFDRRVWAEAPSVPQLAAAYTSGDYGKLLTT